MMCSKSIFTSMFMPFLCVMAQSPMRTPRDNYSARSRDKNISSYFGNMWLGPFWNLRNQAQYQWFMILRNDSFTTMKTGIDSHPLGESPCEMIGERWGGLLSSNNPPLWNRSHRIMLRCMRSAVEDTYNLILVHQLLRNTILYDHISVIFHPPEEANLHLPAGTAQAPQYHTLPPMPWLQQPEKHNRPTRYQLRYCHTI